MSNARESNYDLLRIFSSFAVVMIHVSAGSLKYNDMKAPVNYDLSIIILNTLSRFAVPCFFMTSGAFILADDRNSDYKYFYHKSIKGIGITSLIFCTLYMLYDFVKLVFSIFILHNHGVDYLIIRTFDIIKSVIKGAPYFHLWYLFALLGLYIAAPFVIRLAADLQRGGGVNLYGNISITFLCLASVSYATSDHMLNYDIGLQFCYLSYFLIGYKLRRWGKENKSNVLGLLLIIIGMAINLELGYINYLRGLKGLPVDVINISQNFFSYRPLAPIEVLASCLIFAGFSAITVKQNFYKLSQYTFLIYLIHGSILDFIWIVEDRFFSNVAMEARSVIILSIVVFFISLIGAIAYTQFEQIVMKIRLFRKE